MAENNLKLIKDKKQDKPAVTDKEKVENTWENTCKLLADVSGGTLTKTLASQILLLGDKQMDSEGTLNDMKSLAPKDHIERMLAVQMVATHNAAMNCLRIAAHSTRVDTINLTINSANKLLRTYTGQMEALNKHRGKVQQKMTVEHVHVNSGGQAIIGSVNSNKEK